MTAPVKFYFDLMSQPCRALYIFFKSANIPFQGVPIGIRKGEHISEEFEKINRFKKLPCIEDKNIKLSESVAIMRYLARTHPEIPDHWYPKDIKKQAQIDEYLEWQHLNTRYPCVQHFLQSFLWPRVNRPTTEESVQIAKSGMINCLDELEQLWLEHPTKNRFLVGDKISVADLLAICELEQLKLTGYDPAEGRPNLKAWMELVRNETNPHYDEAHFIIKKMTKSVTEKKGSKL